MPDFTVRGNPAGVRERAAVARTKGQSFVDVAADLSKITTDGWTGRAADHFRDAFDAEPQRWRAAGNGFITAANALDGYAAVLQDVQRRAAEAKAEYERGEQVTTQARAAYDADVRRARDEAAQRTAAGQYTVAVIHPFSDPGEQIRQNALGWLSSARADLDAAAHTCAQGVRAGCEAAPEKRNWFETGVAFVGGILLGAGEALWDLGKLVTTPIWRPVTDLVDLATGRLTPEEVAMTYRLSVEQVGAMAQALWDDPVGFGTELGKGLLDWDTWADDPARAIGHLLPDAVAALFTAGTGAAATRGASGLSMLARHGDDLLDGAGDLATGLNRVDDLGDLNRLDHLDDLSSRRMDDLGGPTPDPLPDLSDIPHSKGTDEWAQAVSDRYPRLTPDDVLGVYDYTTNDGYTTMNRFLRDPSSLSAEDAHAAQARVDRAVSGLEKLPTSPGVTFRGTNLPPEVLARWSEGERVSDAAFMSTSTDPGVAERFGSIAIRVEGRSGVDVQALSHYGTDEAEILFRPGVEFDVVHRDLDPATGRTRITLREVP